MDKNTTSPELTADQLEFREITGPIDPALAQLLSSKEGVHPASALTIMHNRIAPADIRSDEQDDVRGVWDKHCYGLFAPGSDKPEAVIYAKFMERSRNGSGEVPNHKLTGNILAILNEGGKLIESPNTAIFYSITNIGAGKVKRAPSGNSVGEELINRVAAHLSHEYSIPTLTTLSPMRRGIGEKADGFTQWLKEALAGRSVLTTAEHEKLTTLAPGITDMFAAIRHVHAHFFDLAVQNQRFFSQLMTDLGVQYLAEAKGAVKAAGDPKVALDTVEHFHLSNGAMLANIHYHPPGRTTESEDIGALGLMANYRYEPDMLAVRKHMYKNGRIVMDEALESRHLARMEKLKIPGKASVLVGLHDYLSRNTDGISNALQ